jgi:hypothetical protein
MRPDASAIPLSYGSARRRLRVSRRFVVAAVAVLLLGAVAWWALTRPRDISTAKEPFDGHFVQRDATGQVLQETVWRKGKLVSAWETTRPSRWVNNRRVVDPPQWTQVVKDGNGSITYFDEQGRAFGFASYLRGNFDRGAH